jgi:hypothetical protein
MQLVYDMLLNANATMCACADDAAAGQVAFSDGAAQTGLLDPAAPEVEQESWLSFPDIVCEEDDDDDYEDDDNVFDDDDEMEDDEEFEDDEFLDDEEEVDDEEGEGENEEDLEDDEL